MEKLCKRCSTVKPLEDFAKGKNKDGRHSWCRKCASANRLNSYYKNHAKERERLNDQKLAYREENRINVWNYLLTHPCVDCGASDPRILEFDHIDPKTKTMSIANAIQKWSWKSVLNEIQKCQILCANCHRIRTYKQQGYWIGPL